VTPPLRCVSHDDAETAIASLRLRAEAIRIAELARNERRLSALSAGERRAVELLTARIVSKLLHVPTVRIKEAAGGRGGELYVGVLQQLFGLDEAVL
jgi:glutamyl-tRNA reductase